MIVQSVHNIVFSHVCISVGGDKDSVCVCVLCVYLYIHYRLQLWTLSLIPIPTTLASIVGPPIQAWGHINHHLCIKRPKLVQS